jgi:hypothetical protein
MRSQVRTGDSNRQPRHAIAEAIWRATRHGASSRAAKQRVTYYGGKLSGILPYCEMA